MVHAAAGPAPCGCRARRPSRALAKQGFPLWALVGTPPHFLAFPLPLAAALPLPAAFALLAFSLAEPGAFFLAEVGAFFLPGPAAFLGPAFLVAVVFLTPPAAFCSSQAEISPSGESRSGGGGGAGQSVAVQPADGLAARGGARAKDRRGSPGAHTVHTQ